MALDFSKLNAELDNIIEQKEPIVTREQIDLLKKTLRAIKSARLELDKAKRAGINVNDRLAQLKDSETKASQIIKVYE